MSPFSQRLILIWFAFKSFLLWVYCLKFCIWGWKRKILPKCKHHGIKETVGFFVFVFRFHFLKIQTTLNFLQKHISNAILSSLTHVPMRAHNRALAKAHQQCCPPFSYTRTDACTHAHIPMGGLFLKMLRDKMFIRNKNLKIWFLCLKKQKQTKNRTRSQDIRILFLAALHVWISACFLSQPHWHYLQGTWVLTHSLRVFQGRIHLLLFWKTFWFL